MTTTDRLTEIEARLSAATPGPWGHWPEAGTIEIIGTDEPGSSEPRSPFALIASEVRPANGWGEEIYEGPEPDAELIAHAPTDLAALVAVVREVEALLAEKYPADGEHTNEAFLDFEQARLDRIEAALQKLGGAA